MPTNQGGVSGSWQGQGVNNNIFDPSGLSGIITLTFNPAPLLCANPATTDINVTTPTAPNISGVPATLCEMDAPVPLPTNQGGVNGNWSGPGVSGNIFNPAGQNGTVTLTFAPNANQCATQATTDIDVTPAVTPNILGIPASICELDQAVSLPTTQSGINGTWSGPGVSNNDFDPSGLNGTVFLVFTPNSGQCANNATTSITIDGAVIPIINGVPSSICANASPVNLQTNQSGISGDWSGQGVIGNIFNPAGLSGPITLTFTPDAGVCAVSTTAEINVGNGGAPNITGVPASICQSASPFPLPTIQDGISGEWSGDGVINNIFNPAGLNGNITLTFTPDASFCADPAITVIEVGSGGAPAISGVPANICQTAQSISLPTTQDGLTGTWSGQGVTNNSFNPAGLSGNITLTFTPDASFCAANATVTISVNNGGTPTITGVPSSLCQSEAAINLPTTQGGMTGTWSGQGVTNNSFNPAGLNGNITLTFTPTASFCAQSATTVIAVNAAATPTLGTTTLCESSGLFALSTLNDPAHPAGTWSGPGVSGGNFDPAGQSGSVTLTFTPSVNCVNTATTSITVNAPIAPALGTASICESDSPLNLATLTNPNYPNGTWSGPGVSGGSFDPNGQNGSVTLTFTASANCTLASTTTVAVNGAPVFSNLDEPCEATNTTYTVSFTLSGGMAPYTIGGVPIAGNSFVSPPINSGDNYSFVVDDAMGCGPITVSGTENCNCTTDAGTMNIGPTPLVVCFVQNGPFSVPFNFNEVLDANDTLLFVLHDNPGATLGTIYATSDTPVIPIPTNIVLGQTYYVSSVAGNTIPTGVSLTDDCLSVSQGFPVQFYLPTLTLGPDVSICANECVNVPLNFTGNPAYLMDYTITVNGSTFGGFAENLPNNSTIEVCPSDYGLTAGTITFTAVAFTDNNACQVYASPNPNLYSMTITVGSSVVNNQNTTVCDGESITVNGTVYDAANPTGSELLPGASFSGCDSVINVNLAFYPPATGTLSQGICPTENLVINGHIYNASHLTGIEILQGVALHGCDSTLNVNLFLLPNTVTNYNPVLCTGGSININGTIYDVSHPTGTEIFAGLAANGCDSIVNVSVSFNSTVTENIVQTLCTDESITVNGTVYNINNPTGTETIPDGSILGCDSVINVNLSFYQPAVNNYNKTLCTGGSEVINGTVYDENNPTGTEVIPNSSVNGCDSTIIVNFSFNSVVTNPITQTLCPDDSITVNGTVYDISNPMGNELIPNGSYLGCDSAIVVNLSFYTPATSTYDDQLCFGGSVNINGTIYDESNPTGTEIFENVTIHGCDSTVVVNLTFGSSVIVSMDETLCPGESVTINGTVYDAGNPTGSETFPMGSYQGCDSIININLSFYEEAIGNITEVLQVGGFIVVNGHVYDEQNPSGIEVFTGASYHNCDSTVIISLTFVGGNAISAITQVNSPLCQFGTDGSIVVQGINGGTPPYVIALNGSNSSPVVSFPVIFDNLTFGFHTLTILDANGTVATQEIFMPDAPPFTLDLGGQQVVTLGNSVTLNASSASQIVSWAWSPPDYLDCTDCPAPTSTPLEDITYTIAVTDINGCTADGTVQILVEKKQEVYVPNAFSPNNDGINDELTIFASPQVESVVGFQIFSRWGEQVFAKFDFAPNDLQLGWDGSFKGQIMDPAVFAWYAEIRFLDGQTRLFKGDVTLVR
ncbi:MAG: gliding motility-associated C-terminal domain-containing protein [Saprospiraceae bacterium]|nr:gliding motility-associated C-terminal domain-containing protein [Saprospiraceae bacterium]